MWITTRIYLRTFAVSFIYKWYETGCKLWLYAEDSCLVYRHNDVCKIEQDLNKNFSDICNWFVDNIPSIHFGEDKTKYILFQGSTNCVHGDECACNMHAKRFSRARNYVHLNQSKHLSSTQKLFKVASCFCVWIQIIFSTARSDIHNLFHLRSCC